MVRNVVYNRQAPQELSSAASSDEIKIDFANRLQARMVAKGIRQSDLARMATVHLAEGSSIGRDSVSSYIRGKALPSPTNLAALAKALSCQTEDLLPVRGLPSVSGAAPALDVKETSDGNVWLRINQAVTWPRALKIMAILKGEA